MLSFSCDLNRLKRGRNLSQSMMCESSSGPSMHACLRTGFPSISTGTMHAPHMPVASTMIELRLATHLTPYGLLRSLTALIMNGGPMVTISASFERTSNEALVAKRSVVGRKDHVEQVTVLGLDLRDSFSPACPEHEAFAPEPRDKSHVVSKLEVRPHDGIHRG